MNPSEQIFIEFVNGNLAPFYARNYPDMLMYAVSILKGSDVVILAEDCVQNAIEKTYYHRDEFESAAQWKMYLLACIRNGAISLLRSSKASLTYTEQLDDSDLQHDYMLDYIKEETLSRLMNAIDNLPADLREIFNLSFEDGLKIADIASRLNLAEITVKKRKAKLIDTLRRLLGKDFAFLAPFLLL